jgi:hypothetical protein
LVQLELGKCRAISGDLADEVGSGIGTLERIQQRGCLQWSWLQLDLGGQLHSHIIALLFYFEQKAVETILTVRMQESPHL